MPSGTYLEAAVLVEREGQPAVPLTVNGNTASAPSRGTPARTRRTRLSHAVERVSTQTRRRRRRLRRHRDDLRRHDEARDADAAGQSVAPTPVVTVDRRRRGADPRRSSAPRSSSSRPASAPPAHRRVERAGLRARPARRVRPRQHLDPRRHNDVRFTLPKNVLNALRRSAGSASNVLTLTPLRRPAARPALRSRARCGCTGQEDHEAQVASRR